MKDKPVLIKMKVKNYQLLKSSFREESLIIVGKHGVTAPFGGVKCLVKNPI